VLTCAHVISDKDEVRVKFNSGLELNAEVVRVNSAQDVALLKLQGRGHNWLPLDAIDVAQLTGQDVFAVGHRSARSLDSPSARASSALPSVR
jgi:S1-C subfamily serine protease